MATVERFKDVSIMKYNNMGRIDISIRDSNDDEVLLTHGEVMFLHQTLTKWIEEKKDVSAKVDEGN